MSPVDGMMMHGTKMKRPWAVLTVLSMYSCSVCILVFSEPDLFDDIYHDVSAHHDAWIVRGIAMLLGVQLMFGPLLGTLSDMYGRKSILMACCIVHSCMTIGLAFVSSKYLTQGVYLLLATLNACFAMGYAMASDSVAKTHLTARFGLVTAAFGVGLTVGLVVGHILWTFHNKAPFGAAMGLNLLGFFIACCCVHETLDEVDRKPFNSIWQAYVSSLGLCRRQSNVFAIFVFYFCVHLAGTIHVVMYFYANYRFGWQLSDMLVFVSFQGFCLVFCMTVALTLLVRMDPTNRHLVLGAFILQASVFAATTATTRGWQLYLLFAIGMLHAVGFPALRSICHQLVHPEDHGTLHGRLAVISTAAVVIPCFVQFETWL
ncbi:hypothetical protein Ae201684_002469 [Aphanomyces euteiches]|uniref:Major facilitator superfamily (MFS) profile domain-containing protein n=1 Tax=Aphanomyces euteiches TaxID=100861 RepID=A0A6G0XQK1_9STRA|nr:hypothetical protein Ae201684_002469 [Aphanomyces euteiches]